MRIVSILAGAYEPGLAPVLTEGRMAHVIGGLVFLLVVAEIAFLMFLDSQNLRKSLRKLRRNTCGEESQPRRPASRQQWRQKLYRNNCVTPEQPDQPPVAAEQMPASAVQVPASAVQVSASGVQVPASAEQAPASGVQVPASAAQVPASAEQVPLSSSDMSVAMLGLV